MRGEVGGGRGKVKLLDGLTLKEVRPLDKPDGGVLCVGFSLTGKLLAAGGKGATVWDVGSGEVVCRLPEAGPVVLGLAFFGDGILLTAGAELRAWDIATGRDAGILTQPVPGVSRLAFSPDGQQTALAFGITH